MSAVTLAQRLLDRFGSLPAMAAAPTDRWREIPGLGMAKIAQVRAALEIGRRLAKQPSTRRKNFSKPGAVASYLAQRLRGLGREQFIVLYLNRRGRLIEDRIEAEGTVHSVTPTVREIAATALRLAASAIIIGHNHPSGDAAPSPEDRILTRRISDALQSIEVRLLDHVVVSDDETFSFAAAGLLSAQPTADPAELLR